MYPHLASYPYPIMSFELTANNPEVTNFTGVFTILTYKTNMIT